MTVDDGLELMLTILVSCGLAFVDDHGQHAVSTDDHYLDAL